MGTYSHILLFQYLLVFLLVYADIAYSKVHHITPLQDGPCFQNSSCITLAQFVTNFNHSETDISLSFLPGNHTLDRELSLAQANHFSMAKDGLDNETVFVECSTSGSGRLLIAEIFSVSISDLHFIGCGNNTVSQVNRLTITATTFQGVQEKTTVLVLYEVSNATIVRSSFLSNAQQYPDNATYLIYSRAYRAALGYVYVNQSTSYGALYIAFSNVSVISSKFMHNRADIGGALVAYNSSIYLVRSTTTRLTLVACSLVNQTLPFAALEWEGLVHETRCMV